MKTVLAFLQNPNFPNGTTDRYVFAYRDNQVFHRWKLKKSMSGGRIYRAFGPEFYKRIIWDNANWRPNWYVGLEGPDYLWIDERIKKFAPQLIITFGNEARDALIDLSPATPMLHCHHPNARHKTQADLDAFAAEVKARMLQ